jgi:4-hydroxy-4-methyl-2-oxoglutarate aldolase
VSDALDALGCRQQALNPLIRPVWPAAKVVGRAFPVTVVATNEEPTLPYDGEMNALDSLEPGDVVLFQVESGVRAALWGELFSCGAIGRGAVGAVVDGYIRDARQIEELGFPTFARGCSPLDTRARAIVTAWGVDAVVGGVAVHPGDIVVGDVDGIVVVPADLIDAVAEFSSSKRGLERSARADLLAGESVRAVWDKFGVF